MIEIKANELIIQYAPAKGSIMELGNQIMNLENLQDVSAKDYYSPQGYKHISIDKNGLNDALPLDLSKPIQDDLGTFDLVTDIGTSEHVSDLYNCLFNVFNFCSEGGIMIHKNPKTGNFPEHGFYFFTLQFWKEYAELAKLEILELFEYPIYHNIIDGWEIIAVLKKTKDSKNPSFDEFIKLNGVFTK